ncbi:MFS transporter [Actinoplanes sp. SE50]|uniref:MFS transporter n=1 Tax=unclassified Actinoplanes TaxID=2626549 RepID=UPI00023EC94E|nr:MULTISPECIES: MFS transporter [unclassified Actinoplanes]AEV83716.1 putative MFS-type transporter [Actinoplanes sp. SE50/110]ATO82140.1 MFS transporter [Actinoplanes sp. SE50]SLL99547.1 MFS transporter [Actinoplanes sp. SE50/110]
MYLASVERPAVRRTDRTQRLAGTVLALGTVSLITDVSSEMVSAILPLYLIAGLGLSPAVYGLIDGVYTGATALLRLAGGYVADRARRRKTVAAVGYGLSAVMKFGLLAAGTAVPWISAAIVADRAGKGLRTAPRDALITLATPATSLGRAFGVHRAMDTAGAFAGPLVALAVLAASGQAYDSVFVVSGCIAMVGVLVLVLFVRDHRGPRPAANTVSLPAAAALLRRKPVRMLLIGAVLLGLSTIGDGFVYLLLQRRESLATGWFPLLAVGTSLTYLLLAVPFGRLADRVGRAPVVLGGYAALVVVYTMLGSGLGGPVTIVAVLVLYGGYYAATDGVLMALAGPLLPAELRTTGLALVQTGQALAYLVSSVLFGLAWQWWDATGAIRAFTVLAVLTLSVSAGLLLRSNRER